MKIYKNFNNIVFSSIVTNKATYLPIKNDGTLTLVTWAELR